MATATSKGFDYRKIAHTNMYKINRPRTALASKVQSPQRPKTALARVEMANGLALT